MNDMILLEESLRAISKLPDEDAGALIKALISGDSENLPPMADLVFPMIKGQVDRMTEYREKQRANGAKGGRPKKPEETQTKPKDNPNETQNEPKEKPPVPVPIPEPIEKEPPTGVRKRFTPPTVEEVREYVREKGYNVDPETFVDFYASKGWFVGKSPMKDWRAAVRTWAKDRKEQTPPNRNQKIQKAYGFSTERQDVDYNKLAWQKMWQEG